MIKKTLIEKLNNIEEVKSKSEGLTKVKFKEDDDWLRNNYEIILLYRKFKIKNQKVNVIIDIGILTNIIIKILLEKLNIKIEKPNNKIFISANGKNIIALEKVNFNFEIQEKKLLIKLQIIESKEEKVLINMKWLKKVKAKINLENDIIKIIKWKLKESLSLSFTLSRL